jgi:hypothetical protein
MSYIPQGVLYDVDLSFRSSPSGGRNSRFRMSECHKAGTKPLLSRRVCVPVHVSGRLYMNTSSGEGLVVGL